jgi:glycosyltransferase involved in cell wall biosynthesis
VIYNLVGLGARQKTNYESHGRVKCVCVSRQNKNQKDQRDIIRAVAKLENVELTLIGSGDLHQPLRELAEKCGVQNRVFFEISRSNAVLMSTLKDFDIYIYNSINYEISKTVMEAALIGLPIIHNRRLPFLAEELNQDYIYLVENSEDGYAEGIESLANDPLLRERLGREAREAAIKLWSPEIIERKIIKLYSSLMDSQE